MPGGSGVLAAKFRRGVSVRAVAILDYIGFKM
jgi:hypothetical protein